MEKFRQLLYDLGDRISLDTFIDEKGTCRLTFNEKFPIQLEVDPSERYLLFISTIIEIPPGKFRENVLKEALKENGRTHGMDGTLGFHLLKNVLTLSHRHPLDDLTGTLLAEILETLVAKIEPWFDAIEKGMPGPNPTSPFPEDKPPQFSMKL